MYDVIIIGGSYAGLSAAMALGRSMRRVLIIDSGKPCNRQTPYSHNFITQDGEAPAAIAEKARQQVLKYNTIQFIREKAIALPAALTTTNAIYLQEQMQWGKITVLVSLRNEWFRDITNYESSNEIVVEKTKLIPRLGLTWAVTKNVNVYGVYTEGFQPQSNTATLMPNTGTLKVGAQFEPLKSDLKELGMKADLLLGKLKVNAAVYEINQKNILINANIPAFPDSLATRGGERSRGFEMDAAGFILPNWQINVSYSYIDAKITNEKDPALIGARKQNTPYSSGNFWTRYNFSAGNALKDIGIGFGVQYNGDMVPWFTRTFKTPAYTLLDAALYYRPGKSAVQLALNINNIANKEYWMGAQNYLRLFPGAPRNVMLTATYKF